MAIGMGLVVTASLWATAVGRAAGHEARGRAAMEERPLEALRELRSALLLHVPLSPCTGRALGGLDRLADLARRRGDTRFAAWVEEARLSSRAATASIWRGGSGWGGTLSGLLLLAWVVLASAVAFGVRPGARGKVLASVAYLLWLVTLVLA